MVVQEQEYEVIICLHANSEFYTEVAALVSQRPNVSAYEVQTRSMDAVLSFGLQQALGDWMIELSDLENLQENYTKILRATKLDSTNVPTLILLRSERRTLRDYLLVKLASKFLPFKAISFEYLPRGSNRAALQNWNRRAFKSKVVQLAPFMSQDLDFKIVKASSTKSRYRTKRLMRRSIRSMVYSSITPLRLISSSALIAAICACFYSVYVVMIKYGSGSTPGWASTNLILSLSSLAVLAILAAICEYLYQIIGVLVHRDSADISRETISTSFSFRNRPNVEKI